MKHAIILAIALAFATISNAQPIKLLDENRVVNYMSVDGKDTSVSVMIYFQNVHYKYITDLKFIHLDTRKQLEEFKADLRKVIETTITDESTLTIEKRDWLFVKTKRFTALNVDDGFCWLSGDLADEGADEKMLETLNRCFIRTK